MTQAPSIQSLRDFEDVVPTENGIAAARERAVEAMERAGLEGDDLFAVELCLHEALVNALVHGVRNCGASQILLSYEIDRRHVRVVVEDDGAEGMPRYGETDLQEGCRGLCLMRAFTSRMHSESGLVAMELDLDTDPVSSSDHISTKVDSGLGAVC